MCRNRIIFRQLTSKANSYVETTICGDSTHSTVFNQISQTISQNFRPNGLVDIICTDPPYCLLTRRRKGGDLRDVKSNSRSKTVDSDEVPRFESVKEYRLFTERWMKNALEITKRDAIVIIWTNFLGKQPILQTASEMNCRYIGEYIWAKRTTTVADNSSKSEIFLRAYESALVFRRDCDQNSPTERISMPWQAGKLADFNVHGDLDFKRIPWSCISDYHDKEPIVNGKNGVMHQHPCHKPSSVLDPLLLTWVRPGDLLLDCFAGSGAILKSAGCVGAKAGFGIEIISRWARAR